MEDSQRFQDSDGCVHRHEAQGRVQDDPEGPARLKY